jgi:anti-sigma factor RsiW
VESKVFRWLANRRHRALREELSAYLDGRLSSEAKRRLEEHLGACAACRSELEELRSVVEAMRSLPTVPAPRSFAIEPAAAPRPRPVGAPRASLALGGLSAAALLVFAVILSADLLTRPGAGTVQKAAAPEAMAPASLQAGEGAQQDEAGAGAETFAPEETPAPAPTAAAPGEAVETPEARAAEVPTPPAPEAEAPASVEEGGGNGGRTVLLGLEVAFGVAFVTALAGAVWLRRRGDIR